MQKTEIIKKYELIAIVDAKLSNEEKEGIRKEAVDIVVKGGGKVINSQVWLEKHKLTFRIKKCGDGTYYLVNFEADNQAAEKIRSNLRLNEKILRYAVIKAG